MPKRLLLYSFLFLLWQPAYSQALHIDSTRFIEGNKCCAGVQYAVPTADNGLLIVGADNGNPGGIIPYFPTDTSTFPNVLIAKIDNARNISWMKVYGGTQDDMAVSACQTPDGGYAVLASTASNDGNITGYKGNGDMWLLRLDGSGNLLWEKTYGSSQSDLPISVSNTPDGGFILLGATNGSDGDVPFHYGDMFSLDWSVIKTDGFGNVQWSRDIGSTADESPYGSILVIDSNYYIFSSSGSIDHDCTDTAWHLGVNTSTDYYVLKLDKSGNVVWDSSYGGRGVEIAKFAMFDTRDSTIVMTGYTYSSDYMITGQHGVTDIWVVKINKSGTLIWQKALGGSADDEGTGICEGPDGGYMAYGENREDCWLFVLDKNGSELTNKIFGGTNVDNSSSVVPYLNGYVATGVSESTVFTEGACNINHFNGSFITYLDYWPVGIKEINETDVSVKLFPNPATTLITLEASRKGEYEIEISDVIGRLVYKGTIADKGQVAVSGWPKGFYLVQVTSEDGVKEVQKLIVQ